MIGQDGSIRRIARITQVEIDMFPVSNLTIEDNHNYFLGPRSILVHNTSVCDDTINRWRKLLAEDKLTTDQMRDRLKVLKFCARRSCLCTGTPLGGCPSLDAGG